MYTVIIRARITYSLHATLPYWHGVIDVEHIFVCKKAELVLQRSGRAH